MMNGTVKAIIAGAVILGIGIAIVLLVLGLNGWDFNVNKNWETHKYECADTVSDIDIDFSAGEMQIEFYDGEQIEVEYSSSERFTTEFKVTNNTLYISTSQVRWYNSFLWFNKIPATKMYIPRSWQLNFDIVINAGAVTFAEGGNYGNIHVELNAGTISMKNVNCMSCNLEVNAGAMNLSDLSCNKLTCEVNAGSVNVKELKCDNINIDISAGSANLVVAGRKEDYTVKVKKSAGSCNLTNQTGTDANKRIDIDISAGSANISFE